MRNWNIKWQLKAGIFAALLAISSAAQAEPYCSVKALGMAGACVAHSQDSLTAFFNPATAAETETRYDLEFLTRWDNKKLVVGPRLDPTRVSGHFHNEHKWDFYGSGGVNYRFGECDDWAAGIQWNNYDHIQTQFNTPIVDFSGATGQDPSFNYRVEALTFTGAYRFNEKHTFGIGVNVYFSWLSTHGLTEFADPVLSSAPGFVTNQGRDEATGVGVTLGWQGRFCDDRATFGVSYSPRVTMGDFSKYRGFVAGHSIDIPETFRFGVSYRMNCCNLIALDYEHRGYSRVKAWHNRFPSDGATFGPTFGDNSGPGFAWKDQNIVRLGLEIPLDPCRTVRFGYRFEQQPWAHSSGTQTALNALTMNCVENYLTTGFTYNLGPCSELSLFAEWGINGTAKGQWPEIGTGGTIFESAVTHYQEQKFATGISFGQRF